MLAVKSCRLEPVKLSLVSTGYSGPYPYGRVTLTCFQTPISKVRQTVLVYTLCTAKNAVLSEPGVIASYHHLPSLYDTSLLRRVFVSNAPVFFPSLGLVLDLLLPDLLPKKLLKVRFHFLIKVIYMRCQNTPLLRGAVIRLTDGCALKGIPSAYRTKWPWFYFSLQNNDTADAELELWLVSDVDKTFSRRPEDVQDAYSPIELSYSGYHHRWDRCNHRPVGRCL